MHQSENDNDLLKNNECEITHFESTKFICKNNVSVLVYSDQNLNIGDWIKVEGTGNDFKNDNFNSPDYEGMYLSKGIKYYFSYPKITVLKSKPTIKTSLYNWLRESKNIEHSYAKMMLFNYVDETNKDIYNKIKKIGLAHIIVISSMHITFAFQYLHKLLGKIIRPNTATVVILALIILYGYLLNFPISFVKAFLLISIGMFIKDKVSKLVLISLLGIGLLIYNPLLAKDISFVLTFGISYYITLVRNRNKKLMAFQIAIMSMLIQIKLSYEIGLFNIFYQASVGTILLLSFVFIVIFPSLLVNVGEVIDQAYTNNIYITVGSISVFHLVIIIFWLLIICNNISKYKQITKLSIATLLIMFSIVIRREIISDDYITFLNVGQADCALVSLNGKKFLIDVGGNHSNTIGENIITPYLKYEGIKDIDYVFVSHNDTDHSGSLQTIQNNFNVRNVIWNNDWESLSIKGIKIKQLNNRRNGSGNDKSQVILFESSNKGFLFLGDVSKEVEDNIVLNVDIPIEIVKVAHHGSSTSTSLEAYKKLSPKYSILSYGKNNYGHPHNEVIDTLNEVGTKQYHTYSHGAIKYDLRTKKIRASNVV